MVGFGILSEQEARDAVNWEVFVTIAAAFGIGTALVNSGVAGGVADFLVTVGTSVGEGCKFVYFVNRNLSFSRQLSALCISRMSNVASFFSAAGLFAAVYLATFLISNIVTNNAAAALIFPIAMDAAEQTGIDVVLMSYCVMLGASASFMSPFGYT
jgi:di/tricarboxylate transporter